MSKAHIAHLTSVHHLSDNRIFEKECKSLVEAGYDVTLLGQHDCDDIIDGVQILGVPKPANRPARMLFTAWAVFKRARAIKADIYHFHDPELIPWCMILRLLGRNVVYDVHEDYVAGLAIVPHLKNRGGALIGRIYGVIEAVAQRCFEIVVAERYYARRLTGAAFVLNYPRLESFEGLDAMERKTPEFGKIRLVYTGVMAINRGACTYAGMASRFAQGDIDGEIRTIGRTPVEVADAMRAICDDPRYLNMTGVGVQIAYDDILETYREPWTAALALFEDTDFSREKEITKFFEYMAAGIPIIASDFPVWRNLIEGEGVGICIEPGSVDAALHAAAWLRDHPDEARAMGERGRRAVAKRYHWQSQADNLIALYERILGNPMPPRMERVEDRPSTKEEVRDKPAPALVHHCAVSEG